MRFLLASLALTTLVASARPADACGPPACWPGAFVPGDNTTVPENAPGLYWRPSIVDNRSADPSMVSLVREGDTTPIPVTPIAQGTDWVLVPQVPLVAGTRYVLAESRECNGTAGARATFTVGPSAPLPTTLGTLELLGHGNFMELEVGAGGSCSTTIGAMAVQVSLTAAPDIAPWKDLLVYETLVDGQPWFTEPSINVRTPPGGSWYGRGIDLLYRICEPDPSAARPGLTAGGHEAAFRATLPGSSITLATPAQAFELMCASPPRRIDNDAACSSTTPASGAFVLFVLALLLVHRTRR
jgi:MYXO-CTERM domain-containing protein